MVVCNPKMITTFLKQLVVDSNFSKFSSFFHNLAVYSFNMLLYVLLIRVVIAYRVGVYEVCKCDIMAFNGCFGYISSPFYTARPLPTIQIDKSV